MKKAFISWNENQLESLKRDILFFDELLYEELGLVYFKAGHKGLTLDESKIDALNADIAFLTSKGVLKQYNLPNNFLEIAPELSMPFWENLQLDGEIGDFLNKILILKDRGINTFDRVQRQDFLHNCKNMLKCSEQRSMLHSVIAMKMDPNIKIAPIISKENLNFGNKKINSLKLVIENIPIPSEKMPLDEILDFKNQNNLSYKRFHSWISKLSKSNLNENELKEELEYMTLEFENRMKLEKTKYRLSQFEVVLSMPFEIIESIIKLNWGKIPKILLKTKMNKINSLIGETKAPCREIAYLSRIQSKFENAT